MAKNDDPASIDDGAQQNGGDVRSFMKEMVSAFRGDLEVSRQNERDFNRRLLDSHDAARAKHPRVQLACVAPFMLVTDEDPEGREVKRGEVFEISAFDLPRYLGRGLPVANSADDKPGVTISQV